MTPWTRVNCQPSQPEPRMGIKLRMKMVGKKMKVVVVIQMPFYNLVVTYA